MIKARNNPFAAQRMDKLAYRFFSGSWDDLLLKLKQNNYRGAIIGPYGSGKTALLEQLGTRLRKEGRQLFQIFVNTDSPYLNFDQWKGLWDSAGPDTLILVDGADLLPTWQRGLLKLISGRAKGLVTAGHSPLGLPVLSENQTSIKLLDKLLDELAGPVEDSLRQKSHALFRLHNGNVRNVLRELYMLYADQ